MKRKSSGFTIVELLIVIVIIGILAALVITVYNGIQQRARNTSRIASAKELQKLLNAYVVQEGKYPSTGRVCIGSGYTDLDNDGTLDCGPVNTILVHPQATPLDSEISKIAKIPKVETSGIRGASGVIYGGFVHMNPSYIIDGQPNRLMLWYWLEGANQNCGLGVLAAGPVGTGYITTSNINSGNQESNVTYCMVAINQP